MPNPFLNPALTVAIALVAGVVAQVVARHIQMPSIVLLLIAGVILGPDVAGLVQPDLLGEALHMLVGFAVAVILFEGGMNLDVRRLRAEALAIRRLVTVGALITAAGATLAARLLMGWEWRLAAVFGTLVIVTGPTVVTPLLRRLRLKDPVNTILQAEGVLIDPIGAIIAVVTLEVLYAEEASMSGAIASAAGKLGTGAVIGFVAGLGIARILRTRRLVPLGLENILVLSLVVALYQISDTIEPESGLGAVTVAGVVVGNARTRLLRELIDFKEQLTVLMIGLLFVLLAADVRLAGVRALGWEAVATVVALILLVRPVQVYLCTLGSRLGWRQRLFIATMAPRGIVAAAVASLFAQQLGDRGMVAEGDELRALVFLVIAITVTLHGLTGGAIASSLGLRRPTRNGYVILGANGLGRALARTLAADGQEVVLIDSNADRVTAAQREGLNVVPGQGLQGSVLSIVDPASRLGFIGLTPNEEVNLLFVKTVGEETREPELFVALLEGHDSVQPDQVHEARASVLFGGDRALDLWANRMDDGAAAIERWRRGEVPAVSAARQPTPEEEGWLLMLAVRRRGRLRPFDDETQLGARDEVAVAIHSERAREVRDWLRDHGWSPIDANEPAGEKRISAKPAADAAEELARQREELPK
jgi:NhaP-type Na+/H+ or K+/H+ antiporter/Trk K+ transport system NAD-binding subunit